ncbi:MAG: glycosyltransferase family 4 protein [Candidatus Bathyarchaeia archaeon]
MKVLQIARQFYPSVGGVERFVHSLSRHLIQRGHHVAVVTLNRCFYLNRDLPSRDIVEEIEVYRIPYWGRQRLFLAPGVLRFVRNYDLLHIHNVDFFLDFLALTKWWHRKPIILSTHGGFFHTRRLAFLKQQYFNLVTRLTIKAVNAVVADSSHDWRLFSRITDKVVQIDNGIDFSDFSDIIKNPIPGLLVYVGRLASNKRVDNLIRAFALVQARYPSARLIIIGADFEGIQPDLEQMADKLGVAANVMFTGVVNQEELRYYLSRAHLFLSASEYEAFGISVLEAMSCGTVPVVNDIDPFRTIIIHGENGFLVDFSNPNLAADVILDALFMDEHNLQDMGVKAQSVARLYSWENVVIKFEKLYSKVLEQCQRNKEYGRLILTR